MLSTSGGFLKLLNFDTHKCIRTMSFSGYGLSKLFNGAYGMLGVIGTNTGSVEDYDLGSGAVTQENEARTEEVWIMCIDDHINDMTILVMGGADKRVFLRALKCPFWTAWTLQRSSSSASASDCNNDDANDEYEGFKLNDTFYFIMGHHDDAPLGGFKN